MPLCACIIDMLSCRTWMISKLNMFVVPMWSLVPMDVSLSTSSQPTLTIKQWTYEIEIYSDTFQNVRHQIICYQKRKKAQTACLAQHARLSKQLPCRLQFKFVKLCRHAKLWQIWKIFIFWMDTSQNVLSTRLDTRWSEQCDREWEKNAIFLFKKHMSIFTLPFSFVPLQMIMPNIWNAST